MGKRNYKLAALMATALFLTEGLCDAAERATLTVVLHVTDFAGMDGSAFAQARAEARRIFDDVGVRLVWVDVADGPQARACEGLNLFVAFLSPHQIRQRTRQGGDEGVLGSASPSSGYAFIYGERILELAPRRRLDEGVLLGRVLSHEVGHLLLAGLGHSRTGLMTAGVQTDPTGLQARFTPREAGAIRARLVGAVGPENRVACGEDRVAASR